MVGTERGTVRNGGGDDVPRLRNQLSALKVKSAPPGRHGDGGGLFLLVRPSGGRFWLLRYKIAGKGHELGLGSAAPGEVSLAAARDKAADLMRLVKAGTDPLDERARKAAEAAAQAHTAQARGKTFKAVAEALMAGKEAGWRNEKHRAQWTSTLEAYAYPFMGDLPVCDVETRHVTAALSPIWTTIPETATRVRGRIEAVLDYAKTMDWRTGENPARWRGHLANILPARAKVARVQHHPALPWREVEAFVKLLRARDAGAARALEFTALTAARTGETLGARWCEIDLAEKLWTVPGERMKAGREHRVPLSVPAMAVLREMAKLRPASDAKGEAFVFPGAIKGRPLSQMAMLVLLRRMERTDITPHGFRSTFRDWASESGVSGDIAEAALAHTVGNKVEAAYRRGDLLDRRRRLMEDWATHCGRTEAKSATVRRIREVR
jgi:integrase